MTAIEINYRSLTRLSGNVGDISKVAQIKLSVKQVGICRVRGKVRLTTYSAV
jgi:hypothetical protein